MTELSELGTDTTIATSCFASVDTTSHYPKLGTPTTGPVADTGLIGGHTTGPVEITHPIGEVPDRQGDFAQRQRIVVETTAESGLSIPSAE